MINHPCKNECSLGLGGDTCNGCGRNIEEVRDWNSYSDDKKAEVIRRIEFRPSKERMNEITEQCTEKILNASDDVLGDFKEVEK